MNVFPQPRIFSLQLHPMGTVFVQPPRPFNANPYAATRIKDDIEDVLLLSVFIFGKRDLISFWLEEPASPLHHSYLSTGGPSFLKSYKMFILSQSTVVLLL